LFSAPIPPPLDGTSAGKASSAVTPACAGPAAVLLPPAGAHLRSVSVSTPPAPPPPPHLRGRSHADGMLLEAAGAGGKVAGRHQRTCTHARSEPRFRVPSFLPGAMLGSVLGPHLGADEGPRPRGRRPRSKSPSSTCAPVWFCAPSSSSASCGRRGCQEDHTPRARTHPPRAHRTRWVGCSQAIERSDRHAAHACTPARRRSCSTRRVRPRHRRHRASHCRARERRCKQHPQHALMDFVGLMNEHRVQPRWHHSGRKARGLAPEGRRVWNAEGVPGGAGGVLRVGGGQCRSHDPQEQGGRRCQLPHSGQEHQGACKQMPGAPAAAPAQRRVERVCIARHRRAYGLGAGRARAQRTTPARLSLRAERWGACGQTVR